MAVVGDVDRARRAYARGGWPEAYDLWSEAGLARLADSDLADFATAAELLGHHDDSVRAMQQEFRSHEESGRPRAAVRTAVRLAMSCATHGEPALFSGWSARAEALLDDVGADSSEAGWVAFVRMFGYLHRGEIPQALQEADRATDAGRRHGDPELVAMGLTGQGRLRLYSDRIPEGLSCLDEAMVRVIAGECGAGRRRARLLHGDRGLPGDQRLRPRRRVDLRPRPLVRRAARVARSSPASARCTAASFSGCTGTGPPRSTSCGLAAQRYVEARIAGCHRAHRPRVGRRPAPSRRARRGRRGVPASRRPRLSSPQPGLALLWLATRAGHCGAGRRSSACWPT